MTDKEIIKALECCTADEDCKHCPLIKELPYCSDDIMVDALNLIKRQKAEIERLKIENQSFRAAANSYKLHYNEARAEAVKEFATRLEEYSYESMGNYGISRMVVSVKDIDNLVKEYEKGR